MSKKIAVIESQFLVKYNAPDNGITVGGTQRYAHELGRLMKEMGYDVFFLTKACRETSFYFEDIGTVKTLVAPIGTKGNRVFSRKVYTFCCEHDASVVCYSDLQLGFWDCYPNSFALQHGIDWDGPNENILTKIKNYIYIQSARKFKRVICVDTNYINWSRIHDKRFFANADRFVYVPNFADESMFKYNYKEYDQSGPFTLLYPRRLVAHRGYDIFIQMCEQLFDLGYNIRPVLAFEDFADDRLKKAIQNCKCSYEVVHPAMSEIKEQYCNAFLTYVPTRWSEGTSLSAIESVSCGCPVICSDVGGLANVVIPGFNGDVVSADVEAFVKATAHILENPQIRNQWARNCETLRFAFGLERWNEKVKEIICEVTA